MSLSQFTQPDYATQSGAAYPTAIDDSVSVMARLAAAFAAHASDPLAMTVEVDAGWLFAGGSLTEVAAQTTGALVAPGSDPRIDRVVVDAASGAAEVVQGAEDPTPAPPSIPAGKLPVCQVVLTVGMTEITNADLTDERVGVAGTSILPMVTAAGVLAPHKNLRVANNAATPASQLDIDADELVVFDAAGGAVKLTGVDLTADVATVGANGLDTGPEPSSTWLHAFVIYNPATGTKAALLSQSATDPALPSGYTFAGYAGAVYNDSGGDFITLRQWDRFAAAGETVDLNDGTAATMTAVALSVPPTARKWSGWVGGTNSRVDFAAIASGGAARIVVSPTNNPLTNFRVPLEMTLVEAATLYYAVISGTDADLGTAGWEY